MKNWKTTFAGFSLAFFSLMANGATFKQAAISTGIAVLGILAKDKTPQTYNNIPK